MSATPHAPALPGVTADGLIVAPVGRRGPWGALRSLRAGMRELRRQGTSAHVSFVLALSPEGRLVSPRDGTAALFLLGYGTDREHGGARTGVGGGPGAADLTAG